MNDIMKELTVGELLALDEAGETSFEIAQHESGSVMISVRRGGRAVMIRLDGDCIGAGHGEGLTKEKLLAMIGDSIRKTKIYLFYFSKICPIDKAHNAAGQHLFIRLSLHGLAGQTVKFF